MIWLDCGSQGRRGKLEGGAAEVRPVLELMASHGKKPHQPGPVVQAPVGQLRGRAARILSTEYQYARPASQRLSQRSCDSGPPPPK